MYTVFGEKISGPNQRYGYADAHGYQNHDEMPYQHVGARYYNPASGRFLQRDPIGIFSGLNVYAYVYNSPLAWIDPSGLSAIAGALPIAGGLAVSDGPLPIGDILGGALLVGALIYDYFTSSNVGPSGKPKRHFPRSPTKKRAKDAARQDGEGTPQHHGPHEPGQKPHYHPTGKDGKKLPHRPHYNYGAMC